MIGSGMPISQSNAPFPKPIAASNDVLHVTFYRR